MQSNTPWWRDPPALESSHGDSSVVGKATPSSSAFSYWALMGFTFVLLLAPQERIPELAPLRLALLTIILAALAFGYHRIRYGLPLLDINLPIKLILLLLAWALLTTPFSYWPGGSLVFLLAKFIKSAIVFVLLTQVIDSVSKLKGITWGLVLMSVPLAATTVANFLSGTQIDGGNRVAGYAAGLTANPNDMALMLNLILPLCVALLLGTRPGGMRFLLASTAVLLVVAIIATFSRAGFLTLLVTGMTYSWYLRRRPQRVWTPVLLILAVFSLPLVPTSYFERINTIVNIEEDTSGSAQTRLGDMKTALKYGLKNPVVGSGLGMNELAMNEQRGETWTEVHNVYLQLLVELGFPGLLIYLLLFRTCLAATGPANLLATVKVKPDSLANITQGLRVSLIGFAAAALFHPVAYHFYFYYFAGLAFSAGRIFLEEKRGVVV